MRILHESGMFFYDKFNGVITNKVPFDVCSLKVRKNNGRIIEVLGRRKFYFKDMDILIVELYSGEISYFQYRKMKNEFIKVDASYIDKTYYM